MVVMIMLILSLVVVGFMLFIGTAEPKPVNEAEPAQDIDSGDGGAD